MDFAAMFIKLITKNGLVAAFIIIGITTWIAYKIGGLTKGRIHGSAIAIFFGLILAYIGGVVGGGHKGLASIPMFAGVGVMGGAMFRDFAIVSTAFGADLREIKKVGLVGVLSLIFGLLTSWVAGVGALINAFTAFLFKKDKEKDLNVKGAYLHMAADALVSVGVLVAGIVISRTGWYIIDPIIGLILAVVILISTWNLLHDSLRLTLDGVPTSIDSQKVVEAIRALPGVDDVHHIHIWAISTTENALTAHIVLKQPESMQEVKHLIRHRLEDFGIGHATLEFEVPGEHCEAVFAED